MTMIDVVPALRRAFVCLTVFSLWGIRIVGAADPVPLRIEDLYLTDQVADAITLPDGQTAIYCRVQSDAETRTTRQSLWRVDASGPPRPLEMGQPDGFSPQLSPDGKWIVFLSTRPFPNGRPSVTPVPPYCDQAADIWLVPVTGGTAIPLKGEGKPYGRVITDKFYARVAFSPDGKRLAFVADEGLDPRTEAERRNNVVVVREDQGEAYEGYGPTQIWIADLIDEPTVHAASKITRLTSDSFWYGDPQWGRDGKFLVVHANRTADQESVRFSINRNYDLWKITLADGRLEQLTTGLGPDVSPRISPDGTRLVCLSSPRSGPHTDIFNLTIIDLRSGGTRLKVLFDHHGPQAEHPPSLPPVYPLPDNCWRDGQLVAYTAFRGLKPDPQCVHIDRGADSVADPLPATVRSPLLPASFPGPKDRLRAADEVVRWTSFDGQEIEGLLTLPPESIAQRPFKLLVMPHGGPHSRTSFGSNFETQIFAMHGYAVFQPNFRGSTGYGKKFLDSDRYDLGGGDMKDIQAGIEFLIGQGLADRNRQFVYGISYGGFMTTWLVGHTRQFRAAAAQNAVTDLNVMWHLSDLSSWTEWEMGGLPWEVVDRMREHSPLSHITQVSTPTLILHSQNDRRCPLAMGRMFHRALKKRGVATEMVIYPDEGHGIRQLPHREDVLRRVLAWFEKYDVPQDAARKPTSR